MESSNESVLSTIISFQIYIQKKTRFYEKNFEEIFAALLLAQISSKFFSKNRIFLVYKSEN